MKRKILNILVALVMVLGLSLIPAIAMGIAEEGCAYIGYELVEGGTGTANWSTTNELLGDYSVKLVGGTTAQDGNNYAAVVIPMDGTMILSEVTSLTYNYTFTTGPGAGKGVHICFYTHDPTDDLTAEISLYSGLASPVGTDIHDVAFGGTPGATGLNTVTILPGTTGFGWFGSDNDTAITQGFGGTGANRPRELEDFQLDDDFGDHIIDRIQIEYGWWGAGDASEPAYIDDITLNDTNYDLEPMLLDAATYETGGTVTVTVYNGNANADPVRIDHIDIAAISTSDAVGITATLDEDGVNTGVFTGSFVTTDTTPPPTDTLLVDSGDIITVECATADSDWGAGAQDGVTVTATVDDTAPVFTDNTTADADYYANGDTIELTVSLDAASLTVTADFSEIDSEYTAGDEVVVDNADTTYTVTYDISADNTILDEEYTITVAAEDGAGNPADDAGFTTSVSVSLDNTDPAVTDEASDPAVVQPDTETDVTFTANVTDEGSGIATVTIDLSDIGGDADQAMTYDDDTELYTYVFDNLDIAEDDYDLTITATDVVGNANDTAVITLRVVEDVTDPEITSTEVEYPVGFESAKEGDDVIITAVVTDDISGVDTVTIDATDIGLTATEAMTLGDDDTYSVTLEVGDVDADTYTLTITATDAADNAATADVTVVVVAELTAYNIDLVEGWNLISTPLIPDDSDIDIILADITDNVSVVWAYVYDEDGLADWKVWGSGAADLDEMVDGQGYWFEMTADNTLTISGVELPAPPDAPPAYSVYEGWNLIGFKSVDAKTATVYLAGDAYADFVRMYGYDTADVVYTNVLIGDSLQPGQGYWLAVSADGTIYP
jgi:hypothetical protein